MKQSCYNTFLAHIFCSVSALIVLLGSFQNVSAYMVGNNPHHRKEVLDLEGKYQLEWVVDWGEKRVNFTVIVETHGAIGFGLTSNGKMTGADIVIGGVSKNGRSYLTDYHAVGNQVPVEDPSQDWTLHSGLESGMHTQLTFSRAFDTCDSQDYPITEDKISIIWAYFEKDRDFTYHRGNRGAYQIYLLHPDYSPPIVRNPHVGASLINPTNYHRVPKVPSSNKNLKVWTLSSQKVIPAEDTTYLCTIHKGPNLAKKHHNVGFEVHFPNEQSRQLVHHLTVARCHAPAGRNNKEFFDPFLQHPGQLCFALGTPLGPMPTEYCTEFYSVWAVGGRPYFSPPHVGIPLGDYQDEYYMMQVHYNNPNRIPNVNVGISIDYYYTSELRANDGGLMVVRHATPGLTPSLLIPPSSLEHQVYGMCSSQCTKQMLPSKGIRIHGVMLHTHNVGSELHLHHFRGNRELPWIESDNNYGFDYQQLRNINKEVRVLPGDLLALRCVYDNTRVNGSVVGGLSSQQEMCAAFIYYYNRFTNHIQCTSQIESNEGREQFLGIGNVTWSNRHLEYIVDPPDELVGLRVSQVSDNFVKWDTRRREELQEFHFRHSHINRCPRELYSFPTAVTRLNPGSARMGHDEMGSNNNNNEWEVRYPYKAIPYQPLKSCSLK